MPFPNSNFQNDQDSRTRKGIIALSIFLVILIGFFIWYNYRLSGSGVVSKKDGILGNLFSSDNNSGTRDDIDGDGLNSEEEQKINSTVTNIDSDNDGLTDGEEVKVYHTNPLQADSDGDSVNDGEEIKNRHNPLDPSANSVWPPAPTSLSPNK